MADLGHDHGHDVVFAMVGTTIRLVVIDLQLLIDPPPPPDQHMAMTNNFHIRMIRMKNAFNQEGNI
jgi:hypothetical protein